MYSVIKAQKTYIYGKMLFCVTNVKPTDGKSVYTNFDLYLQTNFQEMRPISNLK